MNRPEEALQKTVMQYLRGPRLDGNGGALPRSAVCWHTANQRGTRKRWEVALLKALGVLAGIPDVLILYESRLYGIELKSAAGRLTAVQQALHERLRTAGARVETCRTLDSVEYQLLFWKIPLRARMKVSA